MYSSEDNFKSLADKSLTIKRRELDASRTLLANNSYKAPSIETSIADYEKRLIEFRAELSALEKSDKEWSS
jgi:hypothetical protein